jgi:glycosidase
MKKTIGLTFISYLLLLVGCSSKSHEEIALGGNWLFKIDSLNQGVNEKWFSSALDRQDWQNQTLPNYWDRLENLSTYDGVGWYYRTFEIADSLGPSSIYFGGVDDDAEVWLNGINIGSHVGYDEPFYFDVTGALKQGKNEIVVRVVDNGGPGGIYAPVYIVGDAELKRLMKGKYADQSARSSAQWVRNAVIYEVYLRSFSKQGTFKGLERRLPELKSLGVTVLWLMPIHPVGELARKGNLGSPYSVQDYYAVNPEFGTLDDFKSLVDSVHGLGMKIIIDLVANHTSWDSQLMFDHPEWFAKNKEGAIVSPNADWSDVAQLDYRQHELRKYMINMMSYWVREIGIDGYRCDVADMVPLDFWDTARAELDKIKPVMMLAEGKNPEDHLKAFDLTYSWNLYDILKNVVDGKVPVRVLDNVLEKEELHYPRNSLRMRFISNHDKNVQDGPAVRRYTTAGAKAAAVLIFTYPGVPLVYNGDEVGNARRLSLTEKVDIDWSKGREFRSLYTKLAQVRSEHEALRQGDYRRIWCSDSTHVYAFERSEGPDKVRIVINFSDERNTVRVESETELSEFFTGKTILVHKNRVTLTLPPYGYSILTPTTRQ